MKKVIASERELWEGCCRQNRQAQHDLFVRFLPVMFGICRRYSKSKMDAEDLVQDGFMVVFREIKSLQNGSLEGWMRRIFINLCIDRFRKDSRRQTWLLPESGENLDVAEPSNPSLFDFLEEEKLVELINQLPEGARIAFNLHAVEGYSHAEIAVIMNISESTSRVQVAKARRILQEKLSHLKEIKK